MKYGIYKDTGGMLAAFAVPMTVVSNNPEFISDTLSLKRVGSKRPSQRWEIEARLEPLHYGANELFAHIVMKGYSGTVLATVPQNIGVIAAQKEPIAIGTMGNDSFKILNYPGTFNVGGHITVNEDIYEVGSYSKVDGVITIGLVTGVTLLQDYGAAAIQLMDNATDLRPIQADGTQDTNTVHVTGLKVDLTRGNFIRFGSHNKVYMVTGITWTGAVCDITIYPSLRATISNTGMAFRADVVGVWNYDTSNVKGMSFSDGILMDNGVVKLLEYIQ
jgi:hypothetical protein